MGLSRGSVTDLSFPVASIVSSCVSRINGGQKDIHDERHLKQEETLEGRQ